MSTIDRIVRQLRREGYTCIINEDLEGRPDIVALKNGKARLVQVGKSKTKHIAGFDIENVS